jgi:hypothetical protein
MRVQTNELTMKSKRLGGKTLWICLGTCLCILALTARFGEKRASAQASPVPSTSTGQLGISPEQPVAPPQPIVIKSPPPADTSPKASQAVSQDADPKDGQNVQAPIAAMPVAAMPAIPDPDPNNPVAVQSASLLKMAYELKSEVDKTTKDTLSVTVVRRASEIEQLARKMRSK